MNEKKPNIWLRAFYGFDPWEAGYIGWSKESDRNWMLDNASDGDLMLIYGAESAETDKVNRRQLLGFLQIELTPTADTERSSEIAKQRKIEKGWQEKWTHGLIVRRAWRIDYRIEVIHLLPDTYDLKRARFMGREQAKLSSAEIENVLQLPVTEVDVWGEPPVGEREISSVPFKQVFEPSRGLKPTFGNRESAYEDGEHWLYMLRYDGDIAAFLGVDKFSVARKAVVKVGFSNDPEVRCSGLNAGVPPKAKHRWVIWVRSAAYSCGDDAKRAEDVLKREFAKRFESLGGEFFLGDEKELQSQFSSAPSAAKFSVTGAAVRRK